MKSKHTKEYASYKNTYLNGSAGFEILKGNDGEAISDFVYTEPDAQLIADAFNVTNETGFTPRELQKSHAELLEALMFVRRVLASYSSEQSVKAWLKAEQVIKNAKP